MKKASNEALSLKKAADELHKQGKCIKEMTQANPESTLTDPWSLLNSLFVSNKSVLRSVPNFEHFGTEKTICPTACLPPI